MFYLLALLAAGQAADKTPAAAPSLQQQFDAASAAAATPGKCGEAVRAFEAIERTGAAKRSPLVSAAIDVRKGRCLVVLNRDAEGEAAMRRGLPALRARGAAFDGDVRDATIMLGQAAGRRFDYDAAIAEYRIVLDAAKDAERIMPLLLLAQVTMFDHDGQALRYAQEARTIAAASPALNNRDVANVQTIYARVLLNEGRDKEAYDVLRDSLAKQGGLNLKVSLNDIATRSDLAIAALRNKDMDNARRFLVYTGAGRMKNTPFNNAVSLDPPVCDPAAGLTPEDVAIVEFTVEGDGHVTNVAPIFASGSRATAIAFAQAVSGWSWRPEDVRDIPMIFRAATRIELRCLRTSDAPSIYGPAEEAVNAWYVAQGVGKPAWADMPDARALPLQRAAAANTGVAGLHAMQAVATNPVTDPKEMDGLRAQLTARAAALNAPPSLRTLIVLSDKKEYKADQYRAALRAALAEPAIAADPIAASTLRLRIAGPMYKSKSPPDAATLLDQVMAASLPDSHPLKVAALLQRANLLAAANDIAGAQAAFRQTGLTTEQCALAGVRPVLTRSHAGSDDYPTEAVRWGFEGWVRAEFDITPDGRTVTQRAVAAYPPFIFNDAALGVVRSSRWSSSFRPEGALACSGQQRNIVFHMP